MNKIPMTLEGYSKLQKDLEKLTNKERPEIIAAIAEARSHGDLSENAEYQYAKEQQSLIEGKISELESVISLAEIIDVAKLSGNEIKFGATVKILDVDGSWFRPPRMDNAILVNTGQFLERWSNERFRATPHRVIPPKDVNRYSIALFVNPAFEPTCECLPTCTSPGNPPKYPNESYHEFYTWYMNNTYPHYDEFHEGDAT